MASLGVNSSFHGQRASLGRPLGFPLMRFVSAEDIGQVCTDTATALTK